MLLHAEIDAKYMGSELLLSDLKLRIEEGEKVGLIGRNGAGKTTLFNLLSNQDREYDGNIELKRGAVITSTRQEHHGLEGLSAVDYIVSNLPEYKDLHEIIEAYPNQADASMKKIHEYSEALERFGQLGYYEAEDKALQVLQNYQIDKASAIGAFSNLSGGQKRFAELVRVQLSNADLALIDEPTNHMDYIAKAAFIEWFQQASYACLVITHDRDVLASVDKILELKDKRLFSFKGNYDSYLLQNTQKTTDQMQNYEIAQKTIVNLKKQIEYAKAKKPSWSGTADQKNPFVVMEQRLSKKLKEVEAANPKPSFWIDQESVQALNPKMTKHYDKYKAKNIRIGRNTEKERQSQLLTLEDIQVGYDAIPLFAPLSFSLSHGERLQLSGLNGAGKTTLVRAIMDTYNQIEPPTLLAGKMTLSSHLRLAIYEQELGKQLMGIDLVTALETIFQQAGQAVSRQSVMQAMGDYLFDPAVDAGKLVSNLSGGQKARLQLIRMLSQKPNLLILDEPTNHLDLPSIEELENALKAYHGAILYISHDSYFAKNIGGERLELLRAD